MIEFGNLTKCDLHTHTCFCDGKDTPEEMVLSAIEKGLETIGIATHSYTENGSSYCIKKERVKEFQLHVNALKIKYADKIRVLCGVEQEYFSNCSLDGYDYSIGSAHYFYVNGKYYHIDMSKDYLIDCVNKEFGGDIYSACEDYYEKVGNVIEKTGADIIGQFDLINKFNENNALFDVNHPRYVNAYKKALYKLLKTGKPIELNTGAISRGYRTEPYPHTDIIKIIKENGGKLILSSDSHNANNIAFQFDVWQKLL